MLESVLTTELNLSHCSSDFPLGIPHALGDFAGSSTPSALKLLLGADVSEGAAPLSERMVWLFSSCGSSRSDPHLTLASKHVLAVTPHLKEGTSRSAHGCPRLEVGVEPQFPRVIQVIQYHHPLLTIVSCFIIYTYC